MQTLLSAEFADFARRGTKRLPGQTIKDRICLARAVIEQPTYVDPLLDRLIHNTHRIDLSGESLRRNLQSKA